MSIEDRIRERVLAELDLTENLSDVQILEEIRREICLEGKRCALSYDRRKELERHIFHSLRRLDILQDFLEDEDITEIMVNGPSCIFLERQGRIERSKRQFYSAEKLQDVIQQIASTQNQIISETNPILDTRIPEFGARVNIVMSPIAIGSPVLTIRKFPSEPITMERLLEYDYQPARPEKLYAQAKELVPTVPKDPVYKEMIRDSIAQLNLMSKHVEELRRKMDELASSLPEYQTVRSMYGVGPSLGPQIMAEIGDISRFNHREALTAYAGVDPGKNDSGEVVHKSGHASKCGSARLRKALFQVMEAMLQLGPRDDDPVSQFLFKKKAEGKPYLVYMTAGANKFLRVYYGKVKECIRNLPASDSED